MRRYGNWSVQISKKILIRLEKRVVCDGAECVEFPTKNGPVETGPLRRKKVDESDQISSRANSPSLEGRKTLSGILR